MTAHYCPRQVAAYPGREQAGHGRGRWLVVTGTTMRMASSNRLASEQQGEADHGLRY